jgi:lipopolysaccharide transport system ATP-binding protein
MKPHIEVRNLAKAYTIGHDVQSYRALRDEISQVAKHPLRSLRGHRRDTEQLWALRNITFDVNQGDVVGVIGRNGSGKSTLLKILSRIVEPTEGEAILRGRVSSLLEVGTGFHPELTGRENVFLNGALLGMGRREIASKFEEIVDFSEIEKFLDTPVKFYSSGMYVRLAFAVAAHLDPDVLIVDEVLAVGDAAFQRKSLGKMSAVAQAGRTVLFVSHNAQSIRTLCRRGIHLSGGRLLADGSAAEALDSYRAELETADERTVEHERRATGAGGVVIRHVVARDQSGNTPRLFDHGDTVVLEMELSVDLAYQSRELTPAFGVDTEGGERVFTAVSSWVGTAVKASGGSVIVRCIVEAPQLVPSRFLITASVSVGELTLDHAVHAASFEIGASGDIVDPKRDSSHGPVEAAYRFEQQGLTVGAGLTPGTGEASV